MAVQHLSEHIVPTAVQVCGVLPLPALLTNQRPHGGSTRLATWPLAGGLEAGRGRGGVLSSNSRPLPV